MPIPGDIDVCNNICSSSGKVRAPPGQVSGGRWRRVVIPLIFVIAPFEDAPHIDLALDMSAKVLQSIAAAHGRVIEAE